MWRLKALIPKEAGSLEGKVIEVAGSRVQVHKTIAQGGFSFVYLVKDAVSGRSYALKHMICTDRESLDLVQGEISFMSSLRGHPNIVCLHNHSIVDMGRSKECFLLLDYCDKMLVHVMDGLTSRGSFFDERTLLSIFRDVCNAVFAMHNMSPPIAHRDLKAENVLLGPDGVWKLCDFGSCSTKHKRFEQPDEMSIEEDVIRKHTTPAYRAPEMWDLYRREMISEKVDIWALGCLLYRIAFFKSAFDGESKLQILNGNYRIPDSPKYSPAVVQLVRDMLSLDQAGRPSVRQVWQRVNDMLPPEARKGAPDRAPLAERASQRQSSPRGPVAPSRAPPPPPAIARAPAPQPPAPVDSGASFRRTSGGGHFWDAFGDQAKDRSRWGGGGTASEGMLASSPPQRVDPSPPSSPPHQRHPSGSSTAGNGAGSRGNSFLKMTGAGVVDLFNKIKAKAEEAVPGLEHLGGGGGGGGGDEMMYARAGDDGMLMDPGQELPEQGQRPQDSGSARTVSPTKPPGRTPSPSSANQGSASPSPPPYSSPPVYPTSPSPPPYSTVATASNMASAVLPPPYAAAAASPERGRSRPPSDPGAAPFVVEFDNGAMVAPQHRTGGDAAATRAAGPSAPGSRRPSVGALLGSGSLEGAGDVERLQGELQRVTAERELLAERCRKLEIVVADQQAQIVDLQAQVVNSPIRGVVVQDKQAAIWSTAGRPHGPSPMAGPVPTSHSQASGSFWGTAAAANPAGAGFPAAGSVTTAASPSTLGPQPQQWSSSAAGAAAVSQQWSADQWAFDGSKEGKRQGPSGARQASPGRMPTDSGASVAQGQRAPAGGSIWPNPGAGNQWDRSLQGDRPVETDPWKVKMPGIAEGGNASETQGNPALDPFTALSQLNI